MKVEFYLHSSAKFAHMITRLRSNKNQALLTEVGMSVFLLTRYACSNERYTKGLTGVRARSRRQNNEHSKKYYKYMIDLDVHFIL